MLEPKKLIRSIFKRFDIVLIRSQVKNKLRKVCFARDFFDGQY